MSTDSASLVQTGGANRRRGSRKFLI
jgi:hypothetical protein